MVICWVHGSAISAICERNCQVSEEYDLMRWDLIWDPFTAQWEVGFEHLQAYVKEHKNCRVPNDYKSPDGHSLGSWVSFQRARVQPQSKNKLSDERKARLDALGFFWDPL